MLADRLRAWVGIGVVTLLGVAPLRAQEPPPLMPPADHSAPLVPPPVAVPIDTPTSPATMCMTPAAEAPSTWLLSGLFADGEYLFVKARRTALDFAISAPNRTEIPSGDIHSLDWETRSAFRFGFGYELPGQGWAIGVHYTYLHTNDSSTVNPPTGGTVYATLTRGGTFDEVGTATGLSNLNYNVVDLEASKHWAVNDKLDVELSGGGRFAWIDQTLQATYNGGPGGAVNANVSSPVYFDGAGVTLGGEATWKVYRGFGIYGSARASILSGQFHNILSETNNNGQTSIVNLQEHTNQIVPVMELGIGVSFETEHWYAKVGYDLANWFNLVNSPDFPGSADIGKLQRRTSDLTLEGLSLQLGVVF